jgi:hypothetical protein
MVQEEYVMLYRAVMPMAFLSLLSFTAVAGGQESGASNTTSEFRSAPNAETAASTHTKPLENTDVSRSPEQQTPNETLTASESEVKAPKENLTESEVQAPKEHLTASNSEESGLGPNEVVQPTLRRAFKASGTSIPCSVVSYQLAESKPMISLLCPAVQISAPLRVYLKLAWKDIGDVSHFLGQKLVKIGSSANLRSKPGQSRIELTYQNEGDQASRKQWFNVNLVSVGLAKEGDYR